MTISNQTNRTSGVGAGAVLAIPYVFPTLASGDLVVTKRLTSTGAETVLIENAGSDGYTATYGSGGGIVTTSDSIASTSTVHVVRNTPRTQNLNLEQGGAFNADNLEAGLDKLTKLVIQNKDLIDNKGLAFPSTDAAGLTNEVPNSVDRASKVLSFDSAGNATASSAVPTGSVSFSTIGTNIAEAANASAVRTLLSIDAVVDVRDHGATGDGSTDDTAFIQAALDSISAGTVLFPIPSVAYNIDSTLDKPSNVSMVGVSERGSIISYTGTGKAISCSYANATVDSSEISNLKVICTSTATDAIYCKATQDMIIRNVFVDNLTNSGTNGIHLDGACHFMQIQSCRIFAAGVGILLEDQATFLDNNSVVIRDTFAQGTATCVKVVYNSNADHNNLKFDTMKFNPSTQTTNAIIELEQAQETVIHNCYFEPHGSATVPNIKLIGNTANTIITANRLQQNGSHSPGAIQCGGTSFGTIISNNIITGNSGTIVAFESGTDNVFADNTLSVASLLDSWLRPKTIAMTAGKDYTLRHGGWVDREWNISHDFSRFYDDFHLSDSSTLDTRWDIDDGDTVAVQSQAIHGVIDLTTSGTINHTCIMRSPKRIISSNKSILIFRGNIVSVADVNFQVGIWFDATNYIYFELDTGSDSQLHIVSSLAGSETDTNTGLEQGAGAFVYSIEMLLTSLDFLSAGISTGTITTDILTGAAQIHMYIKALTGSAKTLKIDTVTALQVR